jgi:hypothetical protein
MIDEENTHLKMSQNFTSSYAGGKWSAWKPVDELASDLMGQYENMLTTASQLSTSNYYREDDVIYHIPTRIMFYKLGDQWTCVYTNDPKFNLIRQTVMAQHGSTAGGSATIEYTENVFTPDALPRPKKLPPPQVSTQLTTRSSANPSDEPSPRLSEKPSDEPSPRLSEKPSAQPSAQPPATVIPLKRKSVRSLKNMFNNLGNNKT